MTTRYCLLDSALMVGWLLGTVACGSSSGAGGSGGASASGGSGGANPSGGTLSTGGTAASGGAIASGGATSSGGTVVGGGGATGAGGAPSTGGTAATGGAVKSGGATGAGGAGGVTQPGGAIGSGGASSPGGKSGAGGATATGGTVGSGGVSSPGGASGTGGSTQPPATCTPDFTGTDRPQLTDAAAACYTIKNYLAQAGTIGSLVRDDWDPSTTTLTLPTSPTYTVAADGSGTHTKVQDAITAALASGSTSRVYILVKPGTYRELVCVKPPSGVTAIPVTLYGADDASKVTIVYNNGSGVTVTEENTNPCATKDVGSAHGTSDSSTVIVSTRGFQAANLTIANDFAEPAGQSSVQAPALTAQADQLVFQNVRFLGNQDTLQVKSTNVTTVARSYFKGCYVEGDVDFIFGRGTAVFDGCTIKYLTDRKTGSTIFAPSTESSHPFGILVIKSQVGSASGSNITYLGRAWDDSSGTSPNGQIVIRESTLDGSIRSASPWTVAATSGRAFSASGNRMYEYKNTGAAM